MKPDNSERNARVIELRKGGMNPRPIARLMGLSHNVVIGVCGRAGLATPRADITARALAAAKPKTAKEPRARRNRETGSAAERRELHLLRKERAVAMYRDGATHAEIAALLGVKPHSVAIYVKDEPRRRPITWAVGAKPRSLRLQLLTKAFAGHCIARTFGAAGVSPCNWGNWTKDADLVAEAMALSLAQIVADAVVRVVPAIEAEKIAAQKAAERAAINGPILETLSARQRLIIERRLAGDTLEAIGQSLGVTRERVRQIEITCRAKGIVMPNGRELNAAQKRLIKRLHNAGGDRKPRWSADDFFSYAHTVLDGHRTPKRPRKSYTITDEERERRSAWGREMAARRWGDGVAK